MLHLSSLALRRHPERVYPLFAALPSVLSVDYWPPGNAPRLSFCALQHLQILQTFFSLLIKERLDIFALISRSFALGFGYPLNELYVHRVLESISQPPTLLGFSLQSLTPSKRSEKPFGSSYPLLRFLTKPFRPCQYALAVYSRLESRA